MFTLSNLRSPVRNSFFHAPRCASFRPWLYGSTHLAGVADGRFPYRLYQPILCTPFSLTGNVYLATMYTIRRWGLNGASPPNLTRYPHSRCPIYCARTVVSFRLVLARTLNIRRVAPSAYSWITLAASRHPPRTPLSHFEPALPTVPQKTTPGCRTPISCTQMTQPPRSDLWGRRSSRIESATLPPVLVSSTDHFG